VLGTRSQNIRATVPIDIDHQSLESGVKRADRIDLPTRRIPSRGASWVRRPLATQDQIEIAIAIDIAAGHPLLAQVDTPQDYLAPDAGAVLEKDHHTAGRADRDIGATVAVEIQDRDVFNPASRRPDLVTPPLGAVC
jgi:hypothetical protein